MTNIPTHIYRVRAILALLFLSSASLWAQSDDATLINITTLAQLDAIHYDLDGDGTPSGSTAEQTAYRTAFGLTGTNNNTCTGGCKGYELRNNLDFKNGSTDPTMYSIWAEGSTATGAVSEGWVPIGDNSTASDATRFTATFEGNGHTISNLYINRPSTDNVGLFGALGTGSNVRNLGIEGGSVTGGKNVGGLVGRNFGGTISACYATGDATGSGSFVGGLAGANSGAIRACYATGNATGTSKWVGGLVGLSASSGTMSACYATGNASGTHRVGGLVGQNEGAISACYATGNATGTGSNVGGLVGVNQGPISACYATGDASGDAWVGGLVGVNTSTISACYATGNETVNSGGDDVGGLVASNTGTVTNSYFDSTVSNRPAADSHSKTTAQLQTPTVYDDNADATDGSSIYEAWNIDVDNGLAAGVDDATMAGDSDTDDPWDFGTSSEYPVLRWTLM